MTDPPASAPAPVARRGGLLWHRGFRLLRTGETVSNLGDAMATVAMPLVAVVVLHASAFAVSALTAATYLPYLVLGLLAGAYVDRLPLRRLMIACDVIQLALFASLPLAEAFGVLTLTQLILVALLAGTSSMFFNSAYTVYVMTVLPQQDLLEANSKLQGSSSATQVVGPGLGGLAAQALGAARSLYVNAASFVVSAGCLIAIGQSTEAARPRRSSTVREDIVEGIRLVTHDQYLRPQVYWAALLNFGLAGYFALIVVFLVRSVGLHSGAVGAVMTLGGVGGVIGATVARRLAGRFGSARTFLAVGVLTCPFGLIAVAAHRGPGVVFAGLGVFGLEGSLVLGTVILTVFRQSYIEPSALGRVSTSMRMVTYGVAPVGALVAGALGNAVGPRLALAIMLGIGSLSAPLLLTGPFRGRRDLPVRPQSPDA